MMEKKIRKSTEKCFKEYEIEKFKNNLSEIISIFKKDNLFEKKLYIEIFETLNFENKDYNKYECKIYNDQHKLFGIMEL